jgi:dihydroorotase
MASLKEAGARAFSDDGKPLANSRLFRRALQYAHGLDMPVICHSEDLGLSQGGVMHEGAMSTRLGLNGIPSEAESLGVARDVIIAGMTGARIHIAHVSCAQSLDIIRMAKQRGVKVTCETAPHYLLLCDEDVGNYDPMRKMNPPLRTRQDMLALRQGLNDGGIDAIATDHAPHSQLEKEIEFERAAFGVIGLETALGGMLHLVEQGCLTMMRMLELMSANPARILNLPGGELAPGKAADLVFFSPRQPWVVEEFHSLSQNSPFLGFSLPGRARYTLCGGQISYGMENL